MREEITRIPGPDALAILSGECLVIDVGFIFRFGVNDEAVRAEIQGVERDIYFAHHLVAVKSVA